MSVSSGVTAGLAHAIRQGAIPLARTRERLEPEAVVGRRCDVCGNHYAAPLEISLRGESGTFDCFECAIQAMAPTCGHCGCRVIGHGVEEGGLIFCCQHCARVTEAPAASTS